MSVQVPMSSLNEAPKKKTKASKRKHQDTSPAILTDSQSPSKKAKHSPVDSQRVVKSTPATARDDDQTPSRSPFRLKTLSMYLALPPITQNYPKEGLIAEHLSPLLLTYYPPLHGVVMAINDVRLTDEFGNTGSNENGSQQCYALAVAEHCGSFTWLTAEFLVLEPPAGAQIEGFVNAQSEGHLGLVCWNLFNATISSTRLPKDWKFIGGPSRIDPRGVRIERLKDADPNAHKEAEADRTAEANQSQGSKAELSADEQQGYWVNGDGQKVDGSLLFKVVMIDADGGNGNHNNFVNIVGTLLDQEAEDQLVQEEREAWDRRHTPKKSLDRKKKQLAAEMGLQNGDGDEPRLSPSTQKAALKSRKQKPR